MIVVILLLLKACMTALTPYHCVISALVAAHLPLLTVTFAILSKLLQIVCTMLKEFLSSHKKQPTLVAGKSHLPMESGKQKQKTGMVVWP